MPRYRLTAGIHQETGPDGREYIYHPGDVFESLSHTLAKRWPEKFERTDSPLSVTAPIPVRPLDPRLHLSAEEEEMIRKRAQDQSTPKGGQHKTEDPYMPPEYGSRPQPSSQSPLPHPQETPQSAAKQQAENREGDQGGNVLTPTPTKGNDTASVLERQSVVPPSASQQEHNDSGRDWSNPQGQAKQGQGGQEGSQQGQDQNQSQNQGEGDSQGDDGSEQEEGSSYSPDTLQHMTVDELRALAAEEEIDLQGATRKADILQVLKQHPLFRDSKGKR